MILCSTTENRLEDRLELLDENGSFCGYIYVAGSEKSRCYIVEIKSLGNPQLMRHKGKKRRGLPYKSPP